MITRSFAFNSDWNWVSCPVTMMPLLVMRPVPVLISISGISSSSSATAALLPEDSPPRQPARRSGVGTALHSERAKANTPSAWSTPSLWPCPPSSVRGLFFFFFLVVAEYHH
jgi:hypothetical protein